MNDDGRTALARVMARAQRLGVLGARQGVHEHLVPGEVLVRVMAGFGPPPARIVDLGSGAGLPGLQLAVAWPETSVLLVERRQRRADLLSAAIRELGLEARVRVTTSDAEVVARGVERGQSDLVTARSFGPPPMTVEMGLPLLHQGGRMAVVDSRSEDDRWPPADRWTSLGVATIERVVDEGIPIVVLTRSEAPLESWPRSRAARRRGPVY